jgi:hypothetical protein
MKQSSRYLTTDQIAAEFSVHPKTIRIWAKAGKIKEINLGYRTKRYDLHNLK